MKPNDKPPQNDKTAPEPASNKGGIVRRNDRTADKANQQAERQNITSKSADSRMPPVEYPVLITPTEAAIILAIGKRTLAKYTASGAIPSRKVGTLRRFVVRELYAWIDEGCPTHKGAGVAIRAKLEGGAS